MLCFRLLYAIVRRQMFMMCAYARARVLFIGIVQRNWACLTWKSAIEIKSLLLLIKCQVSSFHHFCSPSWFSGNSFSSSLSFTCINAWNPLPVSEIIDMVRRDVRSPFFSSAGMGFFFPQLELWGSHYWWDFCVCDHLITAQVVTWQLRVKGKVTGWRRLLKNCKWMGQ